VTPRKRHRCRHTEHRHPQSAAPKSPPVALPKPMLNSPLREKVSASPPPVRFSVPRTRPSPRRENASRGWRPAVPRLRRRGARAGGPLFGDDHMLPMGWVTGLMRTLQPPRPGEHCSIRGGRLGRFVRRPSFRCRQPPDRPAPGRRAASGGVWRIPPKKERRHPHSLDRAVAGEARRARVIRRAGGLLE
jgi:hypothetical protein